MRHTDRPDPLVVLAAKSRLKETFFYIFIHSVLQCSVSHSFIHSVLYHIFLFPSVLQDNRARQMEVDLVPKTCEAVAVATAA